MEGGVGETSADEHGHADGFERGSVGFVPGVAITAVAQFGGPIRAEAGRFFGHGDPEDGETFFADPARADKIAVEVGKSLPWADRPEMGGMESGHAVLADGEIGDSFQADFPGAPGLGGDPFDDVEIVLGLVLRKRFGGALGGAAAAQVEIDDRVPSGDPEGGIGRFPAGEGGKGDGGGLREKTVLQIRAAPRAGFQGDKILVVGMGGKDGGDAVVAGGPENVGAEHGAVTHGDRHVPTDLQAVRRGKNFYPWPEESADPAAGQIEPVVGAGRWRGHKFPMGMGGGLWSESFRRVIGGFKKQFDDGCRGPSLKAQR